MRRWLRAHPLAVDALLATVVFVAILLGAATEPHGPDGKPRFGEREVGAASVVLAAFASAALLLRRRAPLRVLCVTTLVATLALVLDARSDAGAEHLAPVFLAAAVSLYTVANRTDRATSLRVGAWTVGVLTVGTLLFGPRPWYMQENLGMLAWTGLAVAAGDAVRSRRAFVDAIRERAERAERTREEEARHRVAEERMRIARELHDVVAHHIALVNVQAGVASHVMESRPDQAKQALSQVREASRHALGELQATVGLLRQSGESRAPTEPTPGLDVLDDLVDGFRRAGLHVDVEIDLTEAPASRGESGPLPSAVDLTAYRVAQEALTNVQKHAGSGARAEVRIAAADGAVEVTVEDDGAGAPATAVAGEEGGGHGLVGMRERAAALGGSCETGPLPHTGFRVHVRLPLEGAAHAPEVH
ncbi:sensor histidine kinase [Streptomyces xiaopingdaonensis]|uniref:sensor histidine kinase n=1 Tax=Streptomyces xiaopingdaonensis TaxID=1565415 RepID=UPI00031B5ED6|nr:histidine kinase [Streptomyces xiaopingdaonensis]